MGPCCGNRAKSGLLGENTLPGVVVGRGTEPRGISEACSRLRSPEISGRRRIGEKLLLQSCQGEPQSDAHCAGAERQLGCMRNSFSLEVFCCSTAVSWHLWQTATQVRKHISSSRFRRWRLRVYQSTMQLALYSAYLDNHVRSRIGGFAYFILSACGS